MKKLFYLLIAVLLIACKVDEPKVFQIDPLATVNIKPAAGTVMKVKSNVNVEHLTALEIVKQTTIIQYNFKGDRWERGFESNQRDTISAVPMLKMYGLDIINQEGDYVPDFIESIDCILIKFDTHAPYGAPRDTLAYIPNATLRAAELIIKQAYEAKNEELILNTFNTAFTFIPISGAEYRELKKNKLQ
jgi:hypothetical protein